MSGLKLTPLLLVDVQHLQQPDEDYIKFYEAFFIQCCDEVLWCGGGGGRGGILRDPWCQSSAWWWKIWSWASQYVGDQFCLTSLVYSDELVWDEVMAQCRAPQQTGWTESSDVHMVILIKQGYDFSMVISSRQFQPTIVQSYDMCSNFSHFWAVLHPKVLKLMKPSPLHHTGFFCKTFKTPDFSSHSANWWIMTGSISRWHISIWLWIISCQYEMVVTPLYLAFI